MLGGELYLRSHPASTSSDFKDTLLPPLPSTVCHPSICVVITEYSALRHGQDGICKSQSLRMAILAPKMPISALPRNDSLDLDVPMVFNTAIDIRAS